MIKTICDSVSHIRFPKEDHLPDWARRDKKVTCWICIGTFGKSYFLFIRFYDNGAAALSETSVHFFQTVRCQKCEYIFWMKASRCACNSVNVTQYMSAQSFFILKQGYMFRLKVTHLKALATFSLPDVLTTLGSHSVYNCGIHLVKTF